MGSLSMLKDTSYNTHMLYTNSDRADIYVYDTLKGVCNANSDSVYNINSKKLFGDMLELINMSPFLADKWFFVIEYSKVKALVKKHKGVFTSDSSVFLFKLGNYKDYKELKSELDRVNDIYLSFMKGIEINKLFHEYDLSQKLVNFITSSYASDVDKIFELKEFLDNGDTIESPRDVTRLIGISGGSINKFAMQLLYDMPKSEKGARMVRHNRIRDAKSLVDTYGIRSFKNFLTTSVRDILDIKTLYNQGIIFKRIADLPEVYDKDLVKDGESTKLLFDEKRLSRYSYCLERIEFEIPYSRILNLYCMLKQSKWYSDRDMLEFLYNYYGEVK